MKKIVILLHKHDAGFSSFHYLVKLLMREWSSMGFAVETMRGARPVVAADLLIPHVDLTIMPKAYCTLLNKYPNVVNRRVTDISKSRISSNLLKRDDLYSGPVIVKTERNYGGLPEEQLSGWWHQLSSLPGKVLGKTNFRATGPAADWKRVQRLAPGSYPVFSSLQEVPKDVFSNRALVVEKFLPEIEEGRYLVRQNFFFADKEFNSVLRSREAVVKLAHAVQTAEGSTPPEILSFRQRLGIDYGKIDWVRRNGNPVIFDFNPTPTIQADEFGETVARHLAQGIRTKIR